MDSSHRTEYAAASAGDSKYEYAKSSAHSQCFPFHSLEVFHEHDLPPFHVQPVQALHPDDYSPRIAFAKWYLGKCATDPRFPAKELISMRHP